MPIIKQISIHEKPKVFIKSILADTKTSVVNHASGINTFDDDNLDLTFLDWTVDALYWELKVIFEGYCNEKFDTKLDNTSAKQRVRLHHYIQAFDPKQEITPDKAHIIGIEWAKKSFGSEREIICSTHTKLDTGHIVNHFAIAPYSYNGKCWYSNLKTLSAVRKISDEVCLSHGVSIIEGQNPAKSKKKGNREVLRNEIDRLLKNRLVKTIDELIDGIVSAGYSVTLGQNLNIKPPGRAHVISSETLGVGYSLSEIKQRLEAKIKNKV